MVNIIIFTDFDRHFSFNSLLLNVYLNGSPEMCKISTVFNGCE